MTEEAKPKKDLIELLDEIDRLTFALHKAERERDEALEKARTEAEAAIIADLRESANRWADLRHPRKSVDARNRSIAAALRKAANRFESGEHRKEKTSDE